MAVYDLDGNEVDLTLNDEEKAIAGGSRSTPTPQRARASRLSSGLLGDPEFRSKVSQIENNEGIPQGLIHAVIAKESSGNPDSVSPADESGRRAWGLGQFRDSTAKSLAESTGIPIWQNGRVNLDPDVQLSAMAALLRQNRESLGGDWYDAAWAYHAGPDNVRSFKSTGRYSAYEDKIDPNYKSDIIRLRSRLGDQGADADEPAAKKSILDYGIPMTSEIAAWEPEKPAAPAPEPAAPISPSAMDRVKQGLSAVRNIDLSGPDVKQLHPPVPQNVPTFDPDYQEMEKSLNMTLAPGYVERVKNIYEAATPDDRQRLMSAPGQAGAVARFIDKKYQASNNLYGSVPELQSLSGRREDVEARNRLNGMEPLAAKTMADREVRFGSRPIFGQAKSTDFNFERAAELNGRDIPEQAQPQDQSFGDRLVSTAEKNWNASPIRRGAIQGVDLLQGQAAGMNKMIADAGEMMGVPGAAAYGRAQTAARQKLGMRQNEMGQSQDKFTRAFEGAIASTISNAPGLAVGLLKGGEAVPLMMMSTQVAGDEYSNGVERGLTKSQALSRAVAFGAMEYIGEKLGFKDQIDMIKNSVGGNVQNVEKLFLKTLGEQIAGEELTTIGEWRIDKSKAIGLNPDSTAKELLEQMKDTLYQTVMQTAMLGAPGAASAVNRKLRESDARYDQPFADAFKPVRETHAARDVYDTTIRTPLGELRNDPEYREIVSNQTNIDDSGLARGKAARQILAERRASNYLGHIETNGVPYAESTDVSNTGNVIPAAGQDLETKQVTGSPGGQQNAETQNGQEQEGQLLGGTSTLNRAAYDITNPDPLNEDDEPLSASDAMFELEVLRDRAIKGKLDTENFAWSPIGKRLDTGLLHSFLGEIKAGRFGFIDQLANRIKETSGAQQNTETGSTDGGLQPRGQVQSLPTGEGGAGDQPGGQENRDLTQETPVGPFSMQRGPGGIAILDGSGTPVSTHQTMADAIEAFDQLSAQSSQQEYQDELQTSAASGNETGTGQIIPGSGQQAPEGTEQGSGQEAQQEGHNGLTAEAESLLKQADAQDALGNAVEAQRLRSLVDRVNKGEFVPEAYLDANNSEGNVGGSVSESSGGEQGPSSADRGTGSAAGGFSGGEAGTGTSGVSGQVSSEAGNAGTGGDSGSSLKQRREARKKRKATFASPEQEQRRADLVHQLSFLRGRLPKAKTAFNRREIEKEIKQAEKELSKLPEGMLTQRGATDLRGKNVSESELVKIWLQGANNVLDDESNIRSGKTADELWEAYASTWENSGQPAPISKAYFQKVLADRAGLSPEEIADDINIKETEELIEKAKAKFGEAKVQELFEQSAEDMARGRGGYFPLVRKALEDLLQIKQAGSSETELPKGWTENGKGGIATNKDPISGGIVDKNIPNKTWFFVSNDRSIPTKEGFKTREDAINALESAVADKAKNGSPAKRLSQNSGIPKGRVGMLMAEGEVVLTASGRQTTPFPSIGNLKSTAGTNIALNRVTRWLMQNAIDEARARDDKFNLRSFEHELESHKSSKDIPQATKDAAEQYLFEQQPPVVKSILKPLVSESERASQVNEQLTKGSSSYGTSNKVFTSDAADKARELLKKKLGQVNTGLDPEMMQAGITLAGYHIEAGARSFAAYSKAMINDLGDAVKPYLRSWYEGVRYYPGIDASEMTSSADIDSGKEGLDDIQQTQQTQQTQKGERHPAEIFADDLLRGAAFKNILGARKRLSEITGETYESGTQSAKKADELIELAGVMAARKIVAQGKSPEETFDRLVALQDQLPSFNVRTSTSVSQQAYSTPLPLAWVASQRVGIDKNTTVVEPTAGNGALLIAASPENTLANELNADRLEALKAEGFNNAKNENAVSFDFGKGWADVVITNPPFGVVKDENGLNTVFRINDQYATTEIDHAIVMNSLKALSERGRAVLIVGGPNKTLTQEGRSDAYNAKAKRSFYYNLYNAYNVVDHFTVSGDLYAKQGAAWPVDVIVIMGRGKSKLRLPAADVPRIVNSIEELKNELRQPEKIGREDLQPAGKAIGTGEESGKDDAVSSEPSAGSGDNDRPPNRQRSGVLGESGSSNSGLQSGSGSSTGQTTSGVRGSGGSDSGANTGQRRSGVAEKPANSYQAPYVPASNAKSVDTLVPVNMQTAVQEALSKVADTHGSVDNYVAQQLGYPVQDLPKYFSAEQIDALSLALDNIQKGKGFIVGDQTGVGKGRIVAAIIRYAIKSGKTPVFVTEKPNLYGDMIRDLTDIGMPDINPILTNAGESIPMDDEAMRWYEESEKAKAAGEKSPPRYGQFMKTKSGKAHASALSDMMKNDSLGEHQVIFTTYSQMQTVKGESTLRHAFLDHFSEGGVVILDESHNAGGQDVSQRGSEETQKTGRAAFVRAMLAKADSVIYSSATYAKRPEVMDLYFKTDMSMGLERASDLAKTLQAGGVPLQQVVAAMLAKAGQYIRREKSFDGIEYNTVSAEVDKSFAESAATVMREIMRFDRVKKVAIKEMDTQLKSEAKQLTSDRSTGGAGVESTNFTSVMHNLISQMLLGLKVKPTIEMAEEALSRGEKPVIALANTMGAAIQDYVETNGLNAGDAINLSFADLFKTYLRKSRRVTIKGPNGEKLQRELTDEELGPAGIKIYRDIEKLIVSSNFDSIPASPIDAIRAALNAKGYSVGEITGRNHTIDYTAPVPIYRVRGSNETSTAGKRKTINDFNSGKLDVVILNQSGATGLSLHASEKFKNQQRRHMILAQPELNIDTHMQMLGRVNRTGQVNKPVYSQLVADVPAEKRPAAVLAKKMAMLNANTTAARDSALKAKDVPDILNEYGDEVVAQYMSDNPSIHQRLGTPLASEEDGLVKEGAVAKITGRIPLLPLKDQERVYAEIEEAYAEMMDVLSRTGGGNLEAQTLDLDAKPKDAQVIQEGVEGSDSPFADTVRAETMDVKRLGKPLTIDQVRDMVAKGAGVAEGEHPPSAIRRYVANLGDIATKGLAAMREKAMEELDDAKQDKVAAQVKKYEGQYAQIHSFVTQYSPGKAIRLTSPQGMEYFGYVGKIENKGGGENPLALGGWKVTVYVADAARQFTLPLSKFGQVAGKWNIETESGDVVTEAFENGQSQSREDRIILTGNMLGAFGAFNKGQIVNFTDANGEVRQGVMMPRGFDLQKSLKAKPVIFKDGTQIQQFMETMQGTRMVRNLDNTVRMGVSAYGSIDLMVPASKAKGGRFFLNQRLISITGDFIKAGQFMRVRFPIDRVAEVAGILSDMGEEFTPATHLEEARQMIEGGNLSPGEKVFKKDVLEPLPKSKWMSAEDIREITSHLLKPFSTAIPVRIEDSVIDVPGVDKKSDGASGLIFDGSLYLFRNGLASRADVVKTLWHELLHLGLRRFMTKKQYIEAMNDLYNKDQWIRERADLWIQSEDAEDVIKSNESRAYLRARGTDEALAYLAELIGGQRETQKKFNRFRRAIRAVTNWLSRLAEKHGFKEAVAEFKGPRPTQEAANIISSVFTKLRNGDAPTNSANSWGTYDPVFSKKNVLGEEPLATWTSPKTTPIDNFIYKMQDKLIDTKRVEQATKDIEDEWSPYQKEMLYHGRAAKQTEDFLTNEVKPLVKAMQEKGVSMDELETYLWNRHAQERNEQIAKINPRMEDGGSGILTEDAMDYLDAIPEDRRNTLDELAAMVDRINDGTKRLLISKEYGLEDPKTIEAWDQTYKFYVPLMRADVDGLSRGNGTGQGISVKGAASKRAMGSNKPVVDILANILMQRERTIVRGEKNRVAVALYGLAIQNENPNFWLPVNPEAIRAPKRTRNELERMGLDPSEIDGLMREPSSRYVDKQTGLVTTRINPALRNRDNVLAVRINGKDRFVFFNTGDPRAARMVVALKNLDADQLGSFLSAIRTVTHTFAAMNTQYNPVWGLFNIFRDTVGGWLNLTSTAIAGKEKDVLSHVGPAIAGIYADLRADRAGWPRSSGEWAKLWEDFQEHGGKTGYRDSFRTSEDRARALQRMLDPSSWADDGLGRFFSVDGRLKVPMDMVRKAASPVATPIFGWLSDFNETTENAIRLSAYKVAIDSGLSKDKAAIIAKNLTVNFNKKGQLASQLGALYAFFNANAQGTARILETLNGPKGKKIIAGGLLVGVIQAFMMAAAGYDDDEPPQFTRERNFVIPVGDRYFSFPYPLGYHVIVSTGRILTEIALGGGKDAGNKVFDLMAAYMESFNPMGSGKSISEVLSPTITDPIVAIERNTDAFGRPIARLDRSELSPTPGFTRAKDTASAFGKWFAEVINTLSGGSDYRPGRASPTPDQIDYLIGQATGGVGREAMKIEQTVSSLVTGEELPPHKIPLLGRFYGDIHSQSAEANRFYQNVTKLNEHEAEIKGLAKNGGDYQTYMQKHPETQLIASANALQNGVSELRARKRLAMSKGNSKEQVKQIENQIVVYMKSLNDRMTALEAKQ